MKMISLTCNSTSFKPLTFNQQGLTLIVGDGSKDKREIGSSNGVGKTLALRLVHHCLGSKTNQGLKSALPDWVFRLTFQLGDKTHQIERSGDSKFLALDEKEIKLKNLQKWLDSCGAFSIDSTFPGLSFRSLIKRFARYELGDCTDPLKTNKEQAFDSYLRSLYLLGLDCSLAVSKRDKKIELDRIKKAKKNWQDDSILLDIFRAGAEPKVRAEWLDREIPKIQADLNKFQVAEDYRDIEHEANELTAQLRKLDKEKAVLNYQIQGINNSLKESPDITRDELLELYKGLEKIFKPEALKHFENVESFHYSLAVNRKNRLTQDKLELQKKIYEVEAKEEKLAKHRDQLLQSLNGKRALDEYATLAQRLADLKEERKRLHEYLNYSSNLQDKKQKINAQLIEEDRAANEYAQQGHEKKIDKIFRSIVERLYPGTPAGIILENNEGNNQIRYNLKIHIEGQESDGINAVRILCFDWLLLMHGANHTIDFLWHDNRFFADIDPKPRAMWFQYIIDNIKNTGKQYIATINTENYEAMQEHLMPNEWALLKESVKITLRGDRPENKLLGLQFSGS